MSHAKWTAEKIGDLFDQGAFMHLTESGDAAIIHPNGARLVVKRTYAIKILEAKTLAGVMCGINGFWYAAIPSRRTILPDPSRFDVREAKVRAR